MRLINLLETTRPLERKAIDPALMTYQEYRGLVDPRHESHPDTAYRYSTDKLNEYDSVRYYPDVLNRIKRNGLWFEVRRSTTDRWKGNYTKTNADGNIVYNEDGLAVRMDPEEVKKMIPEHKRFREEFCIYYPDAGQIVGRTQDEWGCLLIMVGTEYQKFGFGKILIKLAYESNPDRPSGGFTPSGLKVFHDMWSAMVREYLESGFYSFLVRSGQMTNRQVKDILQDLGERKKPQEKDYSTNNPLDWLLMSDLSSYAVIYHKRVYELEDLDDYDEEWGTGRYVIATVHLGGGYSDNASFIGRNFGPESQQTFLMMLMLSLVRGEGLRLTQEQATMVRKRIGDQLQEKQLGNHTDMNLYWVNSPVVDLNAAKLAIKQERMLRKQNDTYDEMYHRILELSDSLGR